MKEPETVASGIEAAALALQQGKLVGFPTETVYGLGANALDAEAVKRIFQAKGRPADNPLIVHVAEPEDLKPLVSAIPSRLPELAARFWPGPLTVIMPRSSLVPEVTSAGLPTVAIRIPNHPVTLALLRQAKLPVAGPSANRSGRPSPTTADHVLADLAGEVAVVLDAGPCRIGVESTVLDLTAPVPTVLRPGGVGLEELKEVLGTVELHPAALALRRARPETAGSGSDGEEAEKDEPVKSPGMKYTHYAPMAPMYLFEEGNKEGHPEVIWEFMRRWIESRAGLPACPPGQAWQIGLGGRIGLLISREGYDWLAKAGISEKDARIFFFILGTREHPETIARNLFTGLRAMDEAGVSLILAEGIPASGVGLAVMNRLRRAAGGNIIKAGEELGQEHVHIYGQEG
ncbi:MAG TPA: threonylcarbamoyl-AMP synthase [Firmicutes bacterium]|nr:threonylcarbamoyl-AMP synthase [Bacillota bacterium]